jgi:membrane protease YdiL (CAAX protease family)
VSTASASVANAPTTVAERPSRSLSIGYLAMLPLLVASEIAQWLDPSAYHNAVELVLERVLAPFGDQAVLLRWALLVAAAIVAWIVALRRGAAIAPGCARVVIEGLIVACVLGPLMVILVRSFDAYLPAIDVSWDPTRRPPSLGATALVFGAGAWEELCFRVGAYSFSYWLALRFLAAFDVNEKLGRFGAEIAGIGVSSALFALAHFDPFLSWVGLPARAWSTPFFVWLCVGGALLGIVFRWRGPGVAAWAHGLFNVALWIGIDPDVIW